MSNEVQTDEHGIPLEAERHLGGIADPAYRPDFARQVVVLCRRGFTQAEIAEFLGVHRHVITRWKGEHDEFAAAFAVGKEQADNRVERGLYERAVGYSHEAVKIFMPKDGSEPVYAPYTEHYPPDPRAAEFWLKNRKRMDWKDKTEVEHTVGVSSELQAAIERGRQRAGLTDGKTIEGK